MIRFRIGKPEPLRHHLSGAWSRRITDEHRLVYQVHDDDVALLPPRGGRGIKLRRQRGRWLTRPRALSYTSTYADQRFFEAVRAA
jgi:hypothetical protein